jgi:hypothetical protein
MLIGSPPAELATRCIRWPDAFRKSWSRSLRRSSSGVRTSPGAERMVQKQNALIGVANSSAARAEAHCIVVTGAAGPAPGRGDAIGPIAGCSIAAVCVEATIK